MPADVSVRLAPGGGMAAFAVPVLPDAPGLAMAGFGAATAARATVVLARDASAPATTEEDAVVFAVVFAVDAGFALEVLACETTLVVAA